MLSSLLSNKDNKLLLKWKETKDKPLFIKGYDGCGKTYIANKLLEDYHLITIASDYIKHGKDITQYLDSCIRKKDIFMMISNNNHYKALLIDDLQFFSQHDKLTMSKIYKYIQTMNLSLNPVIFVCNHIEDKCIKSIKQNSYVIEIKYNYDVYKDILIKHKMNLKTINNVLKKTKNINTILSLGNSFKKLNNDITDPLDITLKNIVNKQYSTSDLLRICSSEYSVLSLNLIENIPTMMNVYKPSLLYQTYRYICIDDYIEYKYISYNLNIYTRVFYSCLLPLYCLKQVPLQLKTIKYNTYISRSIIQIHNQNILKGDTKLYLSLLKYMYDYISNYKTTITINEIRGYIKQNDINTKTLEKQIKVFNYYYKKEFNKKQYVKLIKEITS